MIDSRTDHVGSLLRPPELLEARRRFATGELAPAQLKAVEDRAIDDVLALQDACGCRVVTDGELRRESFQSELTAAVDGFAGVTIDAWLWGEWHSEEVGDVTVERPPDMAVVERLRKRRNLAAEEFVYTRGRTDRVVKVTLPSPSLFANLWTPERSRDAYPTLDEFLEDVTAILCDEVRELARLGCTYVQLDAPHYPLLVDARWRAFYESRGWPADEWLARGIELDNEVIAAMPGMTFGFHLCRGNQGSRWLVAGSYDAIARPVLGGVRAHRLLLEYDDPRSGGFEPLEHVRADQVVVLGLVTTKTPRRETVDELVSRIREASRIVPLERLALGTQCGFSTSTVGNRITVEDEQRKLAVISETAARVWGA